MFIKLTEDQSAAALNLSQSEIDDRVREMVDTEDTDLIWDLRLQNNGRPEEYTEYLSKVKEIIETSVETSVHERRHDDVADNGTSVSYMATALSAADLYRRVNKELENTDVKVPSLQWLRWQFWPSRKNLAKAKHMTGKLKIKYMVQSRQLRKTHIDSYYRASYFRYLKEYTIKYRDYVNLICEDNKHTVKIGEHEFPVAAIERVKAVLVNANKSFVVADHDFTKSTFTPTFLFHCSVPESLSGGFYQGDLHVGIKENAFEHSSILRHCAKNVKVLNTIPFKPIEAHYHDGGSDHSV